MDYNPLIVRALMSLRRIDESTLANIANMAPAALRKWLADEKGWPELVSFETQMEVLRVLGINCDTPRDDIVHYWYVHEPLFSLSSRNYWALRVLTDTFGEADVVYFAKDSDPMASLSSRAHFGLQFPTFKAVLEVTSHPLRNIGFEPDSVGKMRWAPGNFGVLMEQAEFERLAPGLMTPTAFDSQLNVGKELLAWERLGSLARDHNINASQIEALLIGMNPGYKTPKLGKASEPSREFPEPVDALEDDEVGAPEAPPAVATAKAKPKRDEAVATPMSAAFDQSAEAVRAPDAARARRTAPRTRPSGLHARQAWPMPPGKQASSDE